MDSSYAPLGAEADAPGSGPEVGRAAEPADAEQPSKGAEDVEAQERAGLDGDGARKWRRGLWLCRLMLLWSRGQCKARPLCCFGPSLTQP